MKRVFGKSFLYAVDCYEVWQNQRCIEDVDVEGEIYAIPYGIYLYFAFGGLDRAGFSFPFYTFLNSSQSHIIEAHEEGIVNEGRIQYFKEDFEGVNKPYICHLFCKFGRISYVRFATPTENSTPLFPMAEKVYEFYGDMIELGGFTETSKLKIDTICLNMVKNSTNPICNIVVDKTYNCDMKWNPMTSIFRRELNIFAERTKNNSEVNWELLVAYYAIKQIKEYNNAMGYVPKYTIDNICNDVFDAAHSLDVIYAVDVVEQLKFKVYYDLTMSYEL